MEAGLTNPLLESLTTNEQLHHGGVNALYKTTKCCCCKLAYFPLSELHFLGHWKVSIVIPIYVALWMIVCHGLFIYDTYDHFPDIARLILTYSVTGFAFLCVAIAYIAMIVVGPGYVPYDWCRTGKRKNFTWEDMMEHIVEFKDQATWAKTQADKPPRSVYGTTAFRFVLRADHYCSWAKSWVGLKNHRYFMLTCMWACIYSVSNLGFRYWFYLSLVNDGFNIKAIPGLTTIAFLLFLAVFSCYQFVVSMYRLRKNMTSLEHWGNRVNPDWDKGCCRNFEEVCGNRRFGICWPFPFCTCLSPMEDGFYNNIAMFESEISIQTFSDQSIADNK